MAFLEGTFSTPVGTVSKKTAILAGGGIALLVGVMYYRGKKQNVPSTAGASTEINPATGFVYGSEEDAAAMAAQGGYLTGGMVGGSGGGGGGSGGDPPAGTGFTNNAQWVQSTIIGMTNSGVIEDAAALSVAIGKYIAGQPVGDNTVARSLIEQAIAFNGPPPLAGPNGYPPSINTQNPVGEPPATTPPASATTALVPANANLYYALPAIGVQNGITYDINIMRTLNAGIDDRITWPDKGPGIGKTPVFATAQTVRIR
jgi:hypothetical protein